MMKQKRTKLSILGLISLSLVIAAATFGFAEASTIPSAGILSVDYGVKSDYQVSRISYTLDIDNPSLFTAVDFDIDQSGVVILAGVSITEKGNVVWADDCEKGGTSWTCTFDESVDVLAADWLHVISD
jgi:Ethanolamine utilization protein EutJ (predicted chaperonin)